MSVLRFNYKDENWQPIERARATYDPHGRRMDECIEPDCHGAPRYYLVVIGDMECHTRLCRDHEWPEVLQKKYRMKPDPEMAA